MPVYELLDQFNIFPPPELACADGLLAIGGDLSTDRLLNAYSRGIFPWYNPGEDILWWCPKERFVIYPHEIHISNSMKKCIKKTPYVIKFDSDFENIMRNCQLMREGNTWITDEMITAYTQLHHMKNAMCVGIYDNSTLVGGLYGVIIGKCFFGESMFSKAANASKLALISLCKKLSDEKYVFVDCQFHTPHLEKMGGQFISWARYKKLLRKGLAYNESLFHF